MMPYVLMAIFTIAAVFNASEVAAEVRVESGSIEVSACHISLSESECAASDAFRAPLHADAPASFQADCRILFFSPPGGALSASLASRFAGRAPPASRFWVM